ncbi:MAG: glycosyltransferase family 4 protein [Oscillospiraceae bacterium]|jgi:glycosyltransferase involved in cell wall biosynthesis|nr:glycosyltransferase family 4 protein [Oscillospiraceae bacterium]
MRFTIVSQHFYPDTFRINDIARALAARGHTVRVLTGLPDYDTGRLAPVYRMGRLRRETWQGVYIRRVPTTLRRKGSFWRLINYASFAITGWLWACFALADADAVLTFQTSPVSMGIPAQRLARRAKAPHILYCLDVWPDCVTVWGVRPGGAVYRLVRAISARVYRAADTVAVSSRPFAPYLAQVCGVDAGRITYLPQPGEGALDAAPSPYEDNGTVDFVFAGNLGDAQGADVMLDAVEALRLRAGFHLHVVGDGVALPRLRAACRGKGLDALVTFYGRRPAADMPGFYRLADAFVLTLAGGGPVGRTLPGKLQGYLAAGKPVLAAADADGAACQVIREAGAGLCSPPGDSAALAANIAAVLDDPARARAWGQSGRDYYEQEFSWDTFMARLGDCLPHTEKGVAHDV